MRWKKNGIVKRNIQLSKNSAVTKSANEGVRSSFNDVCIISTDTCLKTKCF